jgi:hypothetical protein
MMLSRHIEDGPDQPYNGMGGTPGWFDMQGSGHSGCNLVDEHQEGDAGCFSESGGGGGGSGGGGGGESFGGEGEFVGEFAFQQTGPGLSPVSSAPAKTQGPSPKTAALLATRRLMELTPEGEWQPVAAASRRIDVPIASVSSPRILGPHTSARLSDSAQDEKTPAKSGTEAALDYLFEALGSEGS